MLPMIGLFALLLASLYLMSDATQNSDQFGRLYIWLLLLNTLVLVSLTVLIGMNLYEMIRQVLRREPGSRLTLRLVVMFVVLALAPVSIVYYFSVKFLEHGIDSWFDVQVERALEDAVDLTRASLDFRMRQHLREVEGVAQSLINVPDNLSSLTLNERRGALEAAEMTLFGANNRIIASSSEETQALVPVYPADEILLLLNQGESYVGLDPLKDGGLRVRVVVTVPRPDPIAETRVLQGLFPVAGRISELAEHVQGAFGKYKELTYLRDPLKQSFMITLSLVLLLSVLFAVWTAFYSSRRLMAPIRELAEGTKAVAAGEFHKKLPVSQRDELGFLVRSFNEMMARLSSARDEADRSGRQVERQRAYLEAVLEHLSSGVLSFDRNHVLRTSNAAANEILSAHIEYHIGRRFADFSRELSGLERFYETLAPYISGPEFEWQTQVELFGEGGRKVLMCRGVRLPEDSGLKGGYVIVFDDITALLRAQRDAAWGEVARRLAHEIKNPLTPIQLSAERMQRKLHAQLGEEDAGVLARATRTIVQQVESMKSMVNAFSDYARAPAMEVEPLDLNELVTQVAELYDAQPQGIVIRLELDARRPFVEADAGRLRQLLHNIIKNAIEALENTPEGRLDLSTRCMQEAGGRYVELIAADNGPGIAKEVLGQLFDPYVTDKVKGTGLGLAIVKKIVEEHGGMVWAQNPPEGGARLVIRLPAVHAGEGERGLQEAGGS